MEKPLNIKQYDFYYELRNLPFVEAIWLYGSRARENNRAHSDIDLAIICPKATAEDWSLIQQIVTDADTMFHIDVVRFDALEERDKIKENIFKDKIVLFERKPNSYPWYDSFLDLGEALEQLQEMVREPETENSYVRDATIQRFEFCFELFWKTLKKICLYEQYDVASPRSVLAKAFELKLVEDEALWFMMLEDRNQTTHMYRRKLASEIYYRIKNYHPAMQKAYIEMKKNYNL